jgi:amino-acid N-acetyltransferase
MSVDIKPTDLRSILKYVPLFRDHLFVLSIDDSILDDENIINLFLDIAVLQSLNIRIIVVYAIEFQIQILAQKAQIPIEKVHPKGVTDQLTLQLAIEASGQVEHSIIQGLTKIGLKCALSNAIRATEVGVLNGMDQLFTGKVDKIDLSMLSNFVEKEVIPVISPIVFDRHGQALFVNTDLLASQIAVALSASKLVYLTSCQGVLIDGQLQTDIPIAKIKDILQKNAEFINKSVYNKACYAAEAVENGVHRAHIIDGRMYDGLITEVFSSSGIGTLIHRNEYEQIRKAKKRDVEAIYMTIRNAVKANYLRNWTRQCIQERIYSFYVYEIDENIMGCFCLLDYAEENVMEISSLCIQPFAQRMGIGRKIVAFACQQAKRKKRKKLFALTTQSYGFFKSISGFEKVSPSHLPSIRQKELASSERNSKVLVKIIL